MFQTLNNKFGHKPIIFITIVVMQFTETAG